MGKNNRPWVRLKITKAETLFSPLALPDIEVTVKRTMGKKNRPRCALTVSPSLIGRTARPDSGYISAWYLDEDYDGDCFVDCQIFYDFKKAPNIKSLGIDIDK